jgi:putative FmdB family regulatory protein
MPLYEYECTACHKRTEKIQKFSDTEITICPHCGGHLERVLSAPAISFKGGGWYADGYGNSKPKPAANDGGSSSADSSSATKSDSTVAAAGAPASTPAPAAAPAAAPASSSVKK